MRPALETTELSAIEQQVRTETRPYLRTEAKSKLEELRDALAPDDRMLLVLRLDKGLEWKDVARVMLGDDADGGAAALTREAQRLRKRFQLVKRSWSRPAGGRGCSGRLERSARRGVVDDRSRERSGEPRWALDGARRHPGVGRRDQRATFGAAEPGATEPLRGRCVEEEAQPLESAFRFAHVADGLLEAAALRGDGGADHLPRGGPSGRRGVRAHARRRAQWRAGRARRRHLAPRRRGRRGRAGGAARPARLGAGRGRILKATGDRP